MKNGKKTGITLITGGARSGKSDFALELAAPYDVRTFIATAQAVDPEMAERIKRHKKQRGQRFATIEEPVDLAAAMARADKTTEVVLIDCITVWLGNLMHHKKTNTPDAPLITAFIDALASPFCDIVIVTNEVGLGLIPSDHQSRLFRDMAGSVNRKIAQAADEVYLIACGLPLKLK